MIHEPREKCRMFVHHRFLVPTINLGERGCVRCHVVVVATFSVPSDAAGGKSVVSLTYSSLGRWTASGLHVVQPYITVFMIWHRMPVFLSRNGEVDCSSSGRPYRLRRKLANSTLMSASKVSPSSRKFAARQAWLTRR